MDHLHFFRQTRRPLPSRPAPQALAPRQAWSVWCVLTAMLCLAHKHQTLLELPARSTPLYVGYLTRTSFLAMCVSLPSLAIYMGQSGLVLTHLVHLAAGSGAAAGVHSRACYQWCWAQPFPAEAKYCIPRPTPPPPLPLLPSFISCHDTIRHWRSMLPTN